MHLTLRQAASYLDVPEATVAPLDQRARAARASRERAPALQRDRAVGMGRRTGDPGVAQPARAGAAGAGARAAALGAARDRRHSPRRRRRHQVRSAARRRRPPAAARGGGPRLPVHVLEAREAMGSTGIGDGIAIPHVRNPILLHVAHPFVALCLLAHPVEFDAVDGQPVHALFLVVSPNVPAHLHILAQLGFVLRDAELRRLLRTAAPTEDILARIAALERPRARAVPGPAGGAEHDPMIALAVAAACWGFGALVAVAAGGRASGRRLPRRRQRPEGWPPAQLPRAGCWGVRRSWEPPRGACRPARSPCASMRWRLCSCCRSRPSGPSARCTAWVSAASPGRGGDRRIVRRVQSPPVRHGARRHGEQPRAVPRRLGDDDAELVGARREDHDEAAVRTAGLQYLVAGHAAGAALC